MIGESGGVTTPIYQEQVNRENQIQRDQGVKRETEENISSQGNSDVAAFSTEGLELAKTAVTAVQNTSDAILEQKPQEEQVVPESEPRSSLPAQHLDIVA